MADYKAVFAKPRRIASAISSYFVRTSNGTDRATSGTYSVVSSGAPAFDRKDGLILEAARTQLLYNTGFSGAVSGTPGTAPTGWTNNQTTGQIEAVTAIDLGNKLKFTCTAQRRSIIQTMTVSANTTYVFSCELNAIDAGTMVGVQDIIVIGVVPSGTTYTYRNNGTVIAADATPVVGIVECIISVSSTAGTLQARLGCGAISGNVTGSATVSRPQFEAGAFRSSYIYNTNTGATLTRAASYLGPIPVGDMGIASQTNEYSGHCVVRPQFSSSVDLGSVHKNIMSVGVAAFGLPQIRLEWSEIPGRILLAFNNGTTTVNTTVDTTWSAGEAVSIGWSKGATNGLILVAKGVVGTNTTTDAKSAAASALTLMGLGVRTENLQAESYGPGIVSGFRIWDTALSQAQLEALTVADLDGTTYLTSWSTELGSDPPASVTISDEDITTGSLDWWRFGESADTSENTKSASYATYLGSSANINTPAFGRYAGSTDKQAPLITYSDGTAPSSGSSRAYSSTGVANAGRRNVVTSQGKPLWIHILSGGYDGVHQHVLTTSDSSSPVHTRTNTTGATTVKFWETIVYWGGANGSTLQIDSTAVSGSIGLQLAAITVFPVDPTITSVSPTTIKPGAALTINTLNFASSPSSIAYNSVAEALTSASTTQSVMTAIPLSDFAPSQHHAATNFLTNYTLTLSNGSESASATVQVDPDKTESEDIGAVHATNWFTEIVTKPASAATGDLTFGYWHLGDGVRDETIVGTIESGTGYFAPITRPAYGRIMVYDISGASWLVPQDTPLFGAPTVGVKRVVGGVMASLRRGML